MISHDCDLKPRIQDLVGKMIFLKDLHKGSSQGQTRLKTNQTNIKTSYSISSCDDSHSGAKAAYKMDEHRQSLNRSQSFWPPTGPTIGPTIL